MLTTPYARRLQRCATRLQPALADAVLLFTRVTIGWSFFLAGRGKLSNFDRTAAFFTDLGLPAPAFHAGLVGGLELAGGLLLLSGLGARAAALPLAGTMVVAYLTAHRADGFAGLGAFVDQPPFAYLLATLVVLAFGPGRWAVDRLWRRGDFPSGGPGDTVSHRCCG
jgi:putative oxidoreductase